MYLQIWGIHQWHCISDQQWLLWFYIDPREVFTFSHQLEFTVQTFNNNPVTFLENLTDNALFSLVSSNQYLHLKQSSETMYSNRVHILPQFCQCP